MNEKKKYIELNALIDSFENCYYLYSSTDREVARQALENAPVADVAPVVHGEWLRISDDDQYEGEYYCSVCNAEEFFFGNALFAPFCWHCGAKMDGGKEE